MPISATNLNKAYLAYFGRPADFTGQSYFATKELADVVAAFDTSAESKALYGDNVTAKVNAIYNNLFNRDAEPAGLTYWVNQIQTGNITGAGAALAILNGALSTDATAVENKLQASSAFVAALDTTPEIVGYSGAGAAESARTWLKGVGSTAGSLTSAVAGVDNAVKAAVGTGSAVTSFELKTTQDSVVGTSGDDLFTARIFDNQNTLQSGDSIKGGLGNDTLMADIGNSQRFAITPELNSVENVKIRVQAGQVDSGDNNIAGVGIIDAERVVGTNHWESNNSRADLIVEDVRIGAGQITKDITIAMVETDPGHVDFGVYFDQYSLRAQSNTSSTLTLQVMDTRSQSEGTGPLLNSPYNGFAFLVTAAGSTTPKLVTIASQAIDDAKTYQALADAINVEIAKNPDLKAFTAKLGGNFTVSDTLGSLQTGTEVQITATDGSTVTAEGPNTGWLANGPVPPSSGLHTRITNASNASVDLVTSTIIVDDVGRGSTGGDLVVGGLSVGDTSTSKGVERFNIEVRDNSKLQAISSTNNTLKEVVLTNGVTTSNSFAYVTTQKDAGKLTVFGALAGSQGAGDINQALPGAVRETNINGGLIVNTLDGKERTGFGFTDVRLIDASKMVGSIEFSALVSQASIEKYLNVKDVQASPEGDNIAFQYTGGSNNDVMNVVIDSTVAASRTMTGREDFTFTVDGGAGNDSITVNIGGQETGAWYFDQSLLRNVSINGGAGNDTIRTVGSGDFRVDAGADNDTVYINNTGNVFVPGVGGAAGVNTPLNYVGTQWVVAAANTDLADLQGTATGVGRQFLYKGSVTVVFSGAAAAAAGGVTSGAAANGLNGFEVKVDIDTGANYAVTQYNINQAIKKAINGDAVMSKLLVAEDGPGTTLVIKSLVAGAFAATDLDVLVAGSNYSALPAAEQTTVLNAYKAFTSNTSVALADAQAELAKNGVTGVAASVIGTNGTVGSNSADFTDNTINLGAGNDVLVLSTSANANETVVYTGYGQGADTIVNFSTTGTSADLLDFTAYLNGKQNVAGLTSSIRVTANADAAVEANSVTVLKMTSNATDNFAGLTLEKLLAAVNSTNVAGVANYGGLQSTTLDALTTYSSASTLVGGVGKAIVLIENDRNAGEYKAFELTFDGTATNVNRDFSGAQLVASMDFGNSLAGLNLVGSATALVTGALGAPVVVGPTLTSVVSAAATVNEGSTATFTLNTSGVADGTVINYALSGTGITAADVVGGLLTGTATVMGNMATVNVALSADSTTEGAEVMTLTATLGAQSMASSVTVNDTSTTPAGINVPATGAAGTAAADTFLVNAVAALADVAGTNYQAAITGFDVAADKLVIDLALANAAITTLAQLDGEQGVSVQFNPFTSSILVNFGNDANGGEVTSLTLTGVTDMSLVQVQIV